MAFTCKFIGMTYWTWFLGSLCVLGFSDPMLFKEKLVCTQDEIKLHVCIFYLMIWVFLSRYLCFYLIIWYLCSNIAGFFLGIFVPKSDFCVVYVVLHYFFLNAIGWSLVVYIIFKMIYCWFEFLYVLVSIWEFDCASCS